jgi:hypothetical protein
MTKIEHVKEVLQEALEELGIDCTDSATSLLAENAVLAVESFDNHSTAPVASSDNEVQDLKKKIRQLEGRDVCRNCNGRGYFRKAVGKAHRIYTDCLDCAGTGYAPLEGNTNTVRWRVF